MEGRGPSGFCYTSLFLPVHTSPSWPAAYRISSGPAFHGSHVPETLKTPKETHPFLSRGRQWAGGEKHDGVVFLHMDRIPGEDLVSKEKANHAAQRPSLGTHGPLCFSLLLALPVSLEGPDTLRRHFQSSCS